MVTKNAVFMRSVAFRKRLLNNVFREVLDDDSIELHDETVADDVDGWDSFEHINLVVGVEEEFGFKIPMGKVVTMKNVGEMVDIILELGK